ncbi:hypothetical protein [Sphingomonas turrisvirgatae]|uniref:Uncharacterized protein n=1 Tax=Sphingomonas turrisvirgatae TaxID=1888892 RepID=A0A1E3LQQ3_9SPHN|nr:hypothetical protein [Sphingomonas turrisvirgatae]ODP36073.1 hypothetical protein BFL28_08300 [Sphingomonas turrisvirgatae]
MNWALAAGSLVAVLMLAGIAWALRLGESGRIADAAQAIRLAEEGLAGFEASDAVVCADGGGAVVFGSHGTVALIRPSGARFIVREVRRPQWQASDAGLRIESGDPIPVLLTLNPADAQGVGQRLDAVADIGVNMDRG